MGLLKPGQLVDIEFKYADFAQLICVVSVNNHQFCTNGTNWIYCSGVVGINRFDPATLRSGLILKLSESHHLSYYRVKIHLLLFGVNKVEKITTEFDSFQTLCLLTGNLYQPS
jgi:hypothetical protein